jgi:hypothetical protein
MLSNQVLAEDVVLLILANKQGEKRIALVCFALTCAYDQILSIKLSPLILLSDWVLTKSMEGYALCAHAVQVTPCML